MSGHPASEAPVPPVHVLGVPVHPVTVTVLQEWLSERIEQRQPALVLHANVHGINLAQEMPELRRAYAQADLVFCDGSGVMVAARLQGTTIPERITYADWLPKLAHHCATRSHTMYLLGGAPGVADEAAQALVQETPALRIVGTHDGYFEHDPGSRGTQRVIDNINAVSPDVLLVGLGMPLQERWLCHNWSALDTRIGLTCGAALDYASGRLARGPSVLTDNGFEWLARLAIEPRRLWRRYLVGNPRFVINVVREEVRRRLPGA